MKSLSRVRLFATPMDCSLPGSSVHGIFQARVLEWGASAFQVYAGGSYAYGKEKITEPLALIPTARLPKFFLALNETLLKAKEPFTTWYPDHKEAFLELLKKFA